MDKFLHMGEWSESSDSNEEETYIEENPDSEKIGDSENPEVMDITQSLSPKSKKKRRRKRRA